MKESKLNDLTYSGVLNQMIKKEINVVVDFHSRSDDKQHYRKILDEIISDLSSYAESLPSVNEMVEEGLI
jgi:predicted deacylase